MILIVPTSTALWGLSIQVWCYNDMGSTLGLRLPTSLDISRPAGVHDPRETMAWYYPMSWVSIVMGVPQSLDAWFQENSQKWMMTGGYPHFRKPPYDPQTHSWDIWGVCRSSLGKSGAVPSCCSNFKFQWLMMFVLPSNMLSRTRNILIRCY